jgi:hypothetical protein
MALLHEDFARCLREGRWAFGVLSKDAVGLRLKFGEVIYPVEIEFRDEATARAIVGRVFFTHEITAGAQQSLPEFTSSVNWQLKRGGLELDGSPYLKFRESATVTGLALGAAFVSEFIVRLVAGAAKLEGAVAAVLNGDRPSDAVHLIQQ